MKEKDEDLLLESLARVAPGTDLGLGIEYILQAKTGALIVVSDSDAVLKLVDGGFYIGCSFSPAKFYELAKMDGAIVLNSNADRILYANAHLFPNPQIRTSETGTRHRTAERFAKQTKSLVISISQKRDVVTLFVHKIKYILAEQRVVLSKANQALQTLGKYKEGLDNLIINLTIRELEDLVTLFDVATLLQRSSIVQKTEKEVRRYITELGTDGRLLKMQVDDLMTNVEEDTVRVIRDYSKKDGKIKVESLIKKINDLNDEELLELENITSILGYKSENNLKELKVRSKGFRIISEIRRLPEKVIINLIDKFGSLYNILNASIEELSSVTGMGEVRAKTLFNRLKKYSEYYLYNEVYNTRMNNQGFKL